MVGAPDSPRCGGANVLDRSRRFGADVLALPINAHAVVLGPQPLDLLGYLAWHRRADRLLVLTSEAWTGAATMRCGDLDLLHGAAARAGTMGLRRVLEREARNISVDVADRVSKVLETMPMRSPFDVRSLVASDVRSVVVGPLPGAPTDPAGLFASAALRNLPPPQCAADGAWNVAARSAEELLATLPLGWVPRLDSGLVDGVLQASPLFGVVSAITLQRTDAHVRAQLADLAMRGGAADDVARASPDALLLCAGDEPGWVRLRAGLSRALGGHRPCAPWSTPVLTVTTGLDASADDRINLLLEESAGEAARQRGSGGRYSIVLDATTIRTSETVRLVEDILRRGRKFNVGLVIAGTPESRVFSDSDILSLTGCVVTSAPHGALVLDHGSGETEQLGALDLVQSRLGVRYITTGRMEN